MVFRMDNKLAFDVNSEGTLIYFREYTITLKGY